MGGDTTIWINMEVGQATWNETDIGFGTTQSTDSGWNWGNAVWYQDGTTPNKDVHTLLTIQAGASQVKYYYAGRARAN